MDYVQMTLDDWMSLKKEIAEEFARASASFVRIGFLLRRAEESEGYKNDGYDTLAEWAEAELGITRTYVSRFKAINARYSVGGYSERLQERYVGFGSAKLGEMLALPDADLDMVAPDTKREDIRALKQFNKEAPVAEGADWITDLMHVSPKETTDDIMKLYAAGQLTLKKCSETLNPSGNRLARTRAAVITMKNDGLIVKTFGPDGGRKAVSWQEFADGLMMRIDAGVIGRPPEPERPEDQGKEEQTEKPAQEPEAEKTAEIMPAPEPAEETAEDECQDDTEGTTEGTVEGTVEETAEETVEGDLETEDQEDTEEEQEEEKEKEKKIAPAQIYPGISDISQTPSAIVDEKPQIIKDIESMMKSLKSAVKEGSWNTALSYCQGLEGAIRKCLKEGVKSK